MFYLRWCLGIHVNEKVQLHSITILKYLLASTGCASRRYLKGWFKKIRDNRNESYSKWVAFSSPRSLNALTLRMVALSASKSERNNIRSSPTASPVPQVVDVHLGFPNGSQASADFRTKVLISVLHRQMQKKFVKKHFEKRKKVSQQSIWLQKKKTNQTARNYKFD